ncbi:endonuclease domain-containing protein [Streptomyces sp. NPDC008240]|uniref:endonuclease domain-containing protein n=1 Tax=Streptomyces sp. NPDC008240 TaxID=3364822 RepID=UPI0036E8A8CE
MWPPRPARTASIRRLRAALVDALGPDCHLCGLYPGAMVDHDHQTGQVRGLLCALCNRVLEECPHLTGCPRADYMLDPPAAGLNLTYPASSGGPRQPPASARSRYSASTRSRGCSCTGPLKRRAGARRCHTALTGPSVFGRVPIATLFYLPRDSLTSDTRGRCPRRPFV